MRLRVHLHMAHARYGLRHPRQYAARRPARRTERRRELQQCRPLPQGQAEPRKHTAQPVLHPVGTGPTGVGLGRGPVLGFGPRPRPRPRPDALAHQCPFHLGPLPRARLRYRDRPRRRDRPQHRPRRRARRCGPSAARTTWTEPAVPAAGHHADHDRDHDSHQQDPDSCHATYSTAAPSDLPEPPPPGPPARRRQGRRSPSATDFPLISEHSCFAAASRPEGAEP